MKPGDLIEVETKDKQLKGVFMPNSSEKKLVIKLTSGYNVGILKKNIKKSKVLKEYEEKKVKKGEHKHQKGKKTITILHTGGTVASKVDYETGGVVAKFTPEELIEMFPEIEKVANIKSRLIGNFMSENLRFEDYNKIAKVIKEELEEVDGVIVTHGTDTLHYTSAALSFILQGLSKPVLLVGAQRSSDRGSSDAAMNLICAVEFMVNSKFNEVGVCMHRAMDDDFCVILPGLKCRKLHSSRRDAFKVINEDIVGEVDYRTKKVHIFRGFENKSNDIVLREFNPDVKVGILKVRPNIFAEELEIYDKFDGLVIEGTGLGHISILTHKENEKIYSKLKKLCKKMPVVMSTQCIFGRVNMNVYNVGRELMDIGVLGNYSDMHPELTYIKLAWLLSNFDDKEVKELLHEDLRGEFNKRLSTSHLD
ncbi:Glu-tRNA(Gln) amidotransferase subunit GatD [archaeon]|nr:Glu-tRNA(Gln) amidotransferase subunit GatD [archaeon]MBT4397268.1 Glu-tRNA(Gln) amidotransferase subunit GatD [archaeon]MBT4440648.1 Glu-tRNA(Gln) amidotransferase subunit GatD [archaeon]